MTVICAMDEQYQILALAAVCQAAALVQQLARQGQVDQDAFAASINSILVTEPDSPADVLGERIELRLGLETLRAQLSNKAVAKDAEITRYIASTLAMERKLSKNPRALNQLGERIAQAKRQAEHYDLFDDMMMGNLASIYSDILSPLAPRIQVAGNPKYLKQQSLQHKVRACLLAAIRAAVLWRQLGGKRRQILFNRKRILGIAEQLL